VNEFNDIMIKEYIPMMKSPLTTLFKSSILVIKTPETLLQKELGAFC